MKKPPERIGKYKITGTLGRGGMGDVYKGLQEPLNRIVALKILPEEYSRNEEFLQRFITEAKAISLLEHQNIVGIYDYGVEGDLRYIAMRYIEGLSLAERIQKEKRLSIEETLDTARQICRALKYAHEREILHRDIKPQNILLGKNGQVFVTDFGIAKLYEETSVTRTGVVVGTPEYMSPEQAEGRELNPQTDIYSLGIVLFEMLTGEPPFTGDNPLSIAYKHVNVPPPLVSDKLSGVPKRLDLMVLKSLKKDRTARYRTIDEFLKDLDRVFDEGPDPETRGMHKVTGLHQKELFLQENRVVDRRSSDRRRELRRGASERWEDYKRFNKKKKAAVAVLVLLMLFFAGYGVYRLLHVEGDGGKADSAPAVRTWVGNGSPELAFDDNTATGWNGEGHLPSFSFTFREPHAVNRVDIIGGNHSAPDAFGRSGRPKKIRFTFGSNAEFEAELEDVRDRQVITLPQVFHVQKVKVTVTEVYPGTGDPAVSIAEIKLWNSPGP